MLRITALAMLFLVGVAVGVYGVAPYTSSTKSNSSSATKTPSDDTKYTATSNSQVAAEYQSQTSKNPPDLAKAETGAQMKPLVSHQAEIDEAKFGEVESMVEARPSSEITALDSESIHEIESVHLKGQILNEIPAERLPPSQDIELHQAQELERKKLAKVQNSQN